MKNLFKILATVVSAMVLTLGASGQDYIPINKPTSHLIPVSISGFSPEVESVLKFDLSVLGIQVSEPADYAISGSDNGRVQGSLTQTGMPQPVFVRAYNGGNLRSQAHAFANDIVKELRQTPPIFQTKIAFCVKHGTDSDVCVADFDGYNPVIVTHDNSLVEDASWVPGTRKLLYTSWMRGPTEIYEHNLSTGARRLIAGYPGLNCNAEASPDGQRIAMILSKNGSPNLYVCDSDGGNLKQLTTTRDDDSSPTWSADSREICFVCRRGRAILEKISADGGEAEPFRVTGAYGNLTSPAWSPDGSKIAFTSGSGNFTLWVAPAEGGEAEKLVTGEDPCWAPNSRTIIFTQRRNGRHVLCLLDVPTKHVKDVRQISGSCSEPSWAR
jgi:TolB protein